MARYGQPDCARGARVPQPGPRGIHVLDASRKFRREPKNPAPKKQTRTRTLQPL